jgi:kynureninase
MISSSSLIKSSQTFFGYGADRLRALCEVAGFDEATTHLALEVFAEMLSSYKDRDIGTTPRWKSDVGDDGTPYEFSIALGALPEVRILAEAQTPDPNLDNLWRAATQLSKCLAEKFGADLQRAEQIEHLFYPDDPNCLFSMWHAASFWPGRRPEFKVYYNLQAKGSTKSAALLEEALCLLGYPTSYAKVAHRVLARGPRLDELKYFSLDLALHDRARIKIYSRHHNATAKDLECIIGDAGGASEGDIRNFCAQLLGTEGPFNDRPFASCLSLTDSETPTGGTLYAPLAYYLPHDGDVRQRLEGYLTQQGLPCELYERSIDAFANRPLEQSTGMHSYASFKKEKGRPKVTIYFALEAYQCFTPGMLLNRPSRPKSQLHPVALAALYEKETIADHPLFCRLKRDLVDLGKLWLLFANGLEAISRDFTCWLTHLIVRIQEEPIRALLLKQLNDEMGNGEPTQAHVLLFQALLKDLSPWRPSSFTEAQLASGKRMARGLQRLYQTCSSYEGIGASIVVEILGKQVDASLGEVIRRQQRLDPSSLTWLVLHEELEQEHANESAELAAMVPRQAEVFIQVQQGAEAIEALAWRYFDDLYALLFREGHTRIEAISAPEAVKQTDFAALRKHFPICDERAYFATHCLGPIPAEASADLAAYQDSLRRRNRSLEEWVTRMEEAHTLIEKILRAPKGSVAFGPNATACQGQLTAALIPDPKRNIILTTDMDFPSMHYLWHAQSQRGFQVKTLKSPDGISLPIEALLQALDERVSIVAVPLVSYFNGAMLPAKRLIEAAHAVGARVVLDAYQAVGAVPVDVTVLQVDALVAGTHKWLCGGGVGLGFLYVCPELAERLQPAYPGWLGHETPYTYQKSFTPRPGARRFEQGTPAIEPIYMARAGLSLFSGLSMENFRARSLSLTTRLIKGAEARGLTVKSPLAEEERSGMLCLDAENPSAVTSALAAKGIDVDTRPGTGLRISPHPINTEQECDQLLDEIISLQLSLTGGA